MGENSAIEWTDHTFNPWWGCSHAGSPGCDNCYAKDQAERFGFDCWGRGKARRLLSEKNWEEPYRWNRAVHRGEWEKGKRTIVFCGSMCDYLDPEAPEHLRTKLFEVIETTPYLFWMLLTKRPERMREYLPGLWLSHGCPPHVALGVTAENQEMANKRIPELLGISARYHFASHEPAMGPIKYAPWWLKIEHEGQWLNVVECGHHPESQHLNLIITGGESGKGARPMHPDWAREDRDQCKAADIKFCFKQWGEWGWYQGGYPDQKLPRTFVKGPFHAWMVRVGKKHAGRVLDGRIWNERLV